jgi:hypothetical protein
MEKKGGPNQGPAGVLKRASSPGLNAEEKKVKLFL